MSDGGDRFVRVLLEGARKVGEEDLHQVQDRVVEQKLDGSPPTLVERIGDRVRLFLSAVEDYSSGRYRELPWTTIAMAAFAIIYFLNPADIFPDVIPISGYIDDAGVIAAAFTVLGRDLARYEKWKKSRESKEPGDVVV